MDPVRFGVLGARSMIGRLALFPALHASESAEIIAAAAATGSVPEEFREVDAGSYDAVIDDPNVEAIYIPLPNGLHQQWAERAMRAGKHVLCEKPLAPTPAQAAEMVAVAEEEGVLLAEAWMTPFDPRWIRAIELLRTGAIGEVREINTAFTFTIGPDASENYRWDPAQGGGAMLDVGIYCLGPIVELWDAQPDGVMADQVSSVVRSDRGSVDATTAAVLTWEDGRTATIQCSFIEEERQTFEAVGTTGTLRMDGHAHTGGVGATAIHLAGLDGVSEVVVEQDDLYRRMVDAFTQTVRSGHTWPRPTDDVIAMLTLIHRISEGSRHS